MMFPRTMQLMMGERNTMGAMPVNDTRETSVSVMPLQPRGTETTIIHLEVNASQPMLLCYMATMDTNRMPLEQRLGTMVLQ